ncbi:hypothetical protein [Pantoea septica]|uniref:hypothetical protein n=1 Tax=Pantoea septica TaxID=472695 RepID=UPI0028A0CC03|nr:hypothetical protein [Pantoea septica]
MRERPILLNGYMVRAVLNGSKTQTRRIMTPQPADDIHRHVFPNRDVQGWFSSLKHKHGPTTAHICPFGAVGDRLWVRETFSVVPRTAYAASEGVQQVIRPDDNHDAAIFRAGWEHSTGGIRWRPSIHMLRWASRITLEITGVRVERLASVSNEDARAEGYLADRAADGGNSDPWLWFRDLWDGIYPEQSFKVNPWVWVIEFKRVEGE